jgi:hypothetical protein
MKTMGNTIEDKKDGDNLKKGNKKIDNFQGYNSELINQSH